MRLFAALAAICALSQPAIAKTPTCKTIADTSARLACYDKAAPVAAAKAAAATPTAKPESGKYVDAISAEDTRMNARLKNICRGC
jgi:hypothetical protein